MSRRLVALLAGVAVALVLASGVAIARGGEESDAFSASPLNAEAGQGLSAAAVQKKWLMSRESNTGYRHIFTGLWTPLTGERVGYFAAPKAGYPKVGALYRGGAEVYNYGSPTGDGTTTVNFEVKLPPKTKFAVKPDVAKRKIRCYWFRPSNMTDGEFTGKRWQGNACPRKVTSGGIYGTRFLPPTNNGTWKLPPGYGISVTFPVVSSARLKGYANVPNPACLVGSVWAAGGGTPDGRTWDAPRKGEKCPLDKYHGTDQPIQVAAR